MKTNKIYIVVAKKHDDPQKRGYKYINIYTHRLETNLIGLIEDFPRMDVYRVFLTKKEAVAQYDFLVSISDK
jgi:hypothetical protein